MGGGVYIGDLGDEVYLHWGMHKVTAKQVFRTCSTIHTSVENHSNNLRGYSYSGLGGCPAAGGVGTSNTLLKAASRLLMRIDRERCGILHPSQSVRHNLPFDPLERGPTSSPDFGLSNESVIKCRGRVQRRGSCHSVSLFSFQADIRFVAQPTMLGRAVATFPLGASVQGAICSVWCVMGYEV